MIEKIKLLNPQVALLLQQISPRINPQHLSSVRGLFYGSCCIQNAINSNPSTDYIDNAMINQLYTTQNAVKEILKQQKNITSEDIDSVQKFFKNSLYKDNGLGL